MSDEFGPDELEVLIRSTGQRLGGPAVEAPSYHAAWKRGRRRGLAKRVAVAAAGAVVLIGLAGPGIDRLSRLAGTSPDEVVVGAPPTAVAETDSGGGVATPPTTEPLTSPGSDSGQAEAVPDLDIDDAADHTEAGSDRDASRGVRSQGGSESATGSVEAEVRDHLAESAEADAQAQPVGPTTTAGEASTSPGGDRPAADDSSESGPDTPGQPTETDPVASNGREPELAATGPADNSADNRADNSSDNQADNDPNESNVGGSESPNPDSPPPGTGPQDPDDSGPPISTGPGNPAPTDPDDSVDSNATGEPGSPGLAPVPAPQGGGAVARIYDPVPAEDPAAAGGLACDADADGIAESRCWLLPSYVCTGAGDVKPGYQLIDADADGLGDLCAAAVPTLCDLDGDGLGDIPCSIRRP